MGVEEYERVLERQYEQGEPLQRRYRERSERLPLAGRFGQPEEAESELSKDYRGEVAQLIVEAAEVD